MPQTTTQPHPLAKYADRIDASADYTARQLAALLELSLSSVHMMAGYGWLPGSRMRTPARGGRKYTWTGQQLLRLAGRRIKVQYDHERYAPSTLYRVGCRCPECTAAHNTESRQRRRALAEEKFPEPQRTRLVELVGEGTPVEDAAQEVGVSVGYVFGRATWDAAFADALDDAGWALCVLGESSPACGTAGAYRGNDSKRSPRPPCRGTGCREYKRESSRQTHST
ncbi:hypothetical protein [Streptomyces sp. MC1]|uniref:hypothetical protein n=1 Tax=Streptomyces sp. MC1 TaxID=295105 RepID=UPI0027DBA01E|nr:hypothetical protein [Streptomyces sp. MC1]